MGLPLCSALASALLHYDYVQREPCDPSTHVSFARMLLCLQALLSNLAHITKIEMETPKPDALAVLPHLTKVITAGFPVLFRVIGLFRVWLLPPPVVQDLVGECVSEPE